MVKMDIALSDVIGALRTEPEDVILDFTKRLVELVDDDVVAKMRDICIEELESHDEEDHGVPGVAETFAIFEADFVPPVGWVHIEKCDEADYYDDDWEAAQDNFDEVSTLMVGDALRCIARMPNTKEARAMCEYNGDQLVMDTDHNGVMYCGDCNELLKWDEPSKAWYCRECG